MVVFSKDISPLPLSWSEAVKEKVSKNRRLAVAVSGGVDSIVLIYNLWLFAKSDPDLKLICLHVNFGLRGLESDQDEQFVKKICEELCIPFFVKRNEVPKAEKNSGKNSGKNREKSPKKAGIQAWARDFRHSWFKEWQRHGWFIALGHNRDDLKESAFFRALRGHPRGAILGMSEMDGSLVRPLLGVSRSEISSWAIKHGLPWREDSSNQQLIYSRNIIRNVIFPTLDQATPECSEKLFKILKSVDKSQQYIIPKKNFLIPPHSECELRISYELCVYCENTGDEAVWLSTSKRHFDQNTVLLASEGIYYGEQKQLLFIKWADLEIKKTLINRLLISKHH